MNLDELTLADIKALNKLIAGQPAQNPGPYKVGTAYLIRTVTMYYTGRIVSVHPNEIVLEDAAWIADTGRYHKALETGELSEVEPIKGPAIIGRGALVDAVEWPSHVPLPRTVK